MKGNRNSGETYALAHAQNTVPLALRRRTIGDPMRAMTSRDIKQAPCAE